MTHLVVDLFRSHLHTCTIQLEGHQVQKMSPGAGEELRNGSPGRGKRGGGDGDVGGHYKGHRVQEMSPGAGEAVHEKRFVMEVPGIERETEGGGYERSLGTRKVIIYTQSSSNLCKSRPRCTHAHSTLL